MTTEFFGVTRPLFGHRLKLLAVDFDLRARPFPEQHRSPAFMADGNELAGFVPTARPHRDDRFPCEGFSVAVSGMMMSPADLSSASMA